MFLIVILKFPFKSLYEISLVSELKIVTFSRGRSVESLRITPLIFLEKIKVET
ncbi:MAG: hypothetical protein CM15mP102_02560 [Flavobacteriales bacterium]|nr:MAG: hypothetical protein CM15mP102_02560 [Flavobacteriales bacterium]